MRRAGGAKGMARLGSLAFAGLLACAPVQAAADVDLWADFELRPHYATGSADLDDERNLFGGTAAAFLEARVAGNRLVYEGHAQWPDRRDSVRREHLVRQAYVDTTLGDLDLRIGRQNIIWGTADGFKPTDNLTPADLAFLTYDDEGQRFGPLAAQATYFIDFEWSLTGIVLPETRTTVIPEGLLTDAVRDAPERDTGVLRGGDMGYALRLEYAGRGVDASLSYFSGRSHLPIYGIEPATGALFHANPSLQAVGADVVTVVDGTRLHGEAAWRRYSDSRPSVAAFEPSSDIAATFGAEREVIANHTLLGQVLLRRLLDAPPEATAARPQALLDLNASIYGEFDRTQYGASLALTSEWLRGDLETRLTAARWFDGRDVYLQARAAYDISDRLTLNVVGEFYDGPERSIFGVLDKNDRVFVELAIGF